MAFCVHHFSHNRFWFANVDYLYATFTMRQSNLWYLLLQSLQLWVEFILWLTIDINSFAADSFLVIPVNTILYNQQQTRYKPQKKNQTKAYFHRSDADRLISSPIRPIARLHLYYVNYFIVLIDWIDRLNWFLFVIKLSSLVWLLAFAHHTTHRPQQRGGGVWNECKTLFYCKYRVYCR